MAEMSADIKRKLSNENPELTVDLKEIFDLPFFPESDLLRQAIGQAIIDRITERAQSAQFLEASSGAKTYSKEYVESYEFKVYNKSKNDVNLTASGDMLSNMSLELPSDFNKLKIVFPDELEAAKAHGHITGAVGKKRDFFGLTNRDVKEIRDEFEADVLDAMVTFQVGGELTRQGDNGDLDFILENLIGES